jgi:transcriptional regulator with XRE-family HTH domain
MKKNIGQKDEFLNTLGKTIKMLRKDKGMTQQHIVALCDSEKAHISRLEVGKTNPQILTLKKIAENFEVPLTAFFTNIA